MKEIVRLGLWLLFAGLGAVVNTTAAESPLADAFVISLDIDADTYPVIYHLSVNANPDRITGDRTQVVAHLRSSEGMTRVVALDYRGDNQWHTEFAITERARYWIETRVNARTLDDERERVALPTQYFQLPGEGMEDIDPELLRLQAQVEAYEAALERRRTEYEAMTQQRATRLAEDPSLRMPSTDEMAAEQVPGAGVRTAAEPSSWRWLAYSGLVLVNLLILGLAFWLYREFSGGDSESDEADLSEDDSDDVLDEAFDSLGDSEPAMEDFSSSPDKK